MSLAQSNFKQFQLVMSGCVPIACPTANRAKSADPQQTGDSRDDSNVIHCPLSGAGSYPTEEAFVQTVYTILDGRVRELTLPEPDEYVLPGVRWGAFDELMTPAYWRSQAWQHEALGTYSGFRLGGTLAEEVAACLLGGYGMPAELGLAAYARLRGRGLLVGTPAVCTLENALLEPFQYRDRRRAYRFPRQKARYLAACLARLEDLSEPAADTGLRDILATMPGVGPKTASWIVRNYRASNAVAIIDIHILRAGQHVGLFEPEWTPHGHYRDLETAFLCFATAICTPAALLDSLVWDQMRRMPSQSRFRRGARSGCSVTASSPQLSLGFERVRAREPHVLVDSSSHAQAITAA